VALRADGEKCFARTIECRISKGIITESMTPRQAALGAVTVGKPLRTSVFLDNRSQIPLVFQKFEPSSSEYDFANIEDLSQVVTLRVNPKHFGERVIELHACFLAKIPNSRTEETEVIRIPIRITYYGIGDETSSQ
jgi:hypothetical protein